MKIKFYDYLLTLLTPIVKFLGKIHSPFSHKKVSGVDYYKFRDYIEIGDVLLTKTNGELSNLINPAKIKHAGIYVGRILEDDVCYVLEAIGKGVVLTDLVTFMTTKDLVVGCRPNFKRQLEDFNREIQTVALQLKGSPYDFLFNLDGKAFYCFELAATCLKFVYPELQLRCREVIKNKRIYDENTFLDRDFFVKIFSSEDV